MAKKLDEDDLTDSGVVEDKYFSGIVAGICGILVFLVILGFSLAKLF